MAFVCAAIPNILCTASHPFGMQIEIASSVRPSVCKNETLNTLFRDVIKLRYLEVTSTT